MKVYGLHRQITINGKKYTELFTISVKHTIEDMIKHMQNLIELHKLPAIKEADDRIARLENIVDTYNKSEEIKKLEIQYKMSDNYRLEMERNLKVKETEVRRLEAETKLLVVQYKLECMRKGQINNVIMEEFVFDDFDDPVVDNTNPGGKKTKKGTNVTKL